MATSAELRLGYPEAWITPPDRSVQLWTGKDRSNRTQTVRPSDIVCPGGNPRCPPCFTLTGGGTGYVGKSNTSSLETSNVGVQVFNKDLCPRGTGSRTFGANEYVSDLSDHNFNDRINSILFLRNEREDKLPCCFGARAYLEGNLCDPQWIGTDIYDPKSVCYNPIKQAVSWNPHYLQYQNFRDWCRTTGDCDDAMEDYCLNNPDDPICGCLNSPLEGGLAVCADEKCANRAAYRTRDMRDVKCPSIIDCSQIISQVGNINTMTDLVQRQTCQLYQDQGLLGEPPKVVPLPGEPAPTPVPVPPYPPTTLPPTEPTVSIFTTTSTTNYWIWVLLLFMIIIVAAGVYWRRRSKTEPPPVTQTLPTIPTVV